MMFKNLKNEAMDFLNKYKSESPAAYAAAQQAIGGLLILDGLTGIDNSFGGKKRPGIIGALLSIIIGGVLLFAPNFIGNITGINKMTATTNATIVSVNQQQTTSTNSNGNTQNSTVCSVTAKYSANGQEYNQTSSISSSGMCSLSAGQTTTINYNPNNPKQWATDLTGIKTFMKYFPWLGALIMITGLITFIIRLLSIIFGWKLLKSGRALAKTLPEGTNLSTAIKEMEHSFKSSIFGFGGQPTQQPVATPAAQTPEQSVTNNQQ